MDQSLQENLLPKSREILANVHRPPESYGIPSEIGQDPCTAKLGDIGRQVNYANPVKHSNLYTAIATLHVATLKGSNEFQTGF